MVPGLKILVQEHPHFSWEAVHDYLFIAIGALLQALAIRLFLVPGKLVSGGVSGIAQLIDFYTGWPIGLMIFLGNIPLFILGWRLLGGPRFVLRTVFAVVMVSVLTDSLVLVLPRNGLTVDIFLNTLYGGLVSGVGYGLVYRGRGTSGGSDILARILRHWRGISISQSYLLTDSLVILLAGFSFSWTNALYALVVLYVSGLGAEAVMGGSNVDRTAIIITNKAQEVADQILVNMERGVTMLPAKGAYTGAERIVLYCVISRSEVNELKTLVREADPRAFLVIGQANEVLGEGFRSLEM
ncbi:MAG: YitT family protein [Omnitrophica WOR_2 bacterium]